MRLQTKIVIPMILVAAAPLALSSFSALRASRAELVRQVEELHDKSAQNQAEFLGAYLESALRGLRLGAARDYDEMQLASVASTLEALYLDFERLNIVGLRDEQGEARGPDIFVDDRAAFDARYQTHEEVGPDEHRAFAQRVPLAAALRDGQAVGEAYLGPGKDWPLVALAVATPRQGGGRWLHVAELSLADLQKRVAAFAVGQHGLMFVVDGAGRLVLHPEARRALAREDARGLEIVRSGLGKNAPVVQGYQDPARGEMLGAFAPVPRVGWGVVVAQPVGEALAAADRMRAQTLALLGLSLLVAVALGVMSARSISRPVRELAGAAHQVADGNFDLAINVKSRDEVGELAEAFTKMIRRASLFFRYVDRKVVERLVREERLAQPGGEMAQMSILFGDMRSYTPMSNALTPDQTVRVLNTYFSLFIEIVHRFGGVVDKTMGDAIMAFFVEQPGEAEDYKARAVKAVIYMKVASRVLCQYLLEREALGAPGEIVAKQFGFGVASGRTIVGNIGSKARMNYTVCGRVVNLAARLESLTVHGEVIVDHFTAQAAEPLAHLMALAPIVPKGFTDAERIIPAQVVSLRPEQIPPLRATMAALFSREFVAEHLVPPELSDPAARSHAVHLATERLAQLAHSAGPLYEEAGRREGSSGSN